MITIKKYTWFTVRKIRNSVIEMGSSYGDYKSLFEAEIKIKDLYDRSVEKKGDLITTKVTQIESRPE
jgi:hypothetical protein